MKNLIKMFSTAITSEEVPIDIPVTLLSPCHKIASVALPKPAFIAKVIPYAEIIEPIITIKVFIEYFLILHLPLP